MKRKIKDAFGYTIAPLAILALISGFAPYLANAQFNIVVKNASDVNQKLLCPIALFMFNVLIVLATIAVIWGAYLYLTAGGDAEKVTKATKTITYAAVAVVVALIARNFPFIVSSIFNVNLNNSIGC